MNNYASAMLIAGLVLIGVAPSTGTDPVVAYAPHVSAAAVPEGPLDETLNEVVQRSSTTIPRRKEENKANPLSDRWKTLAGIK